jgi:hypothetical protein
MKSQRLKKLLRWGVRIILALVVLLVLFILEEHVRGRILLARYKADLRAKGEKLTLAELDLPKPPKEGNGADALLAAADEIESLRKQQHGNRGLRRRGDDEEDEFSAERYLPETPLMIAPGRAVVRHQQGELLDRPPYPGGELQATGSWEELSVALADADPSLQRARLALGRPAVQVELDYSKGNEIRLPHLSKLRSLSRWFAKDAVMRLRNGHLEEALESLASMAELTKAPKKECVMISQMVRAGMTTALFGACWEALQAEGWTDRQLEELQRIVDLDDFAPPMNCCFEFERASWAQTMEELRQRGLVDQLRADFSPSQWTRWQWRHLAELPSVLVWWIGWFDQDYLRSLQVRETALRELRAALAAPSWSDARRILPEDGWGGEMRSPYDRWRWKLSSMLVGSAWRGAIRKAFQAQTQREMLRAAIALKRYKLRHGEFPPALGALVPEFLSRPPLDYMDGQPLRYRRNADGSFILYSVGKDGVDDGGDPTPRTGKSLWMWSGRDAVWPQPVTPP